MAERTLLKQAREDRNLRQPEVAEAVGCSIDALSCWERGAIPGEYYCNQICGFYGMSRAELGIGEDPHITEGEIAMLQKILGKINLDRRQALELVKQVPALAVLVELVAESPSGILAPPQFLSQCTAAIAAAGNSWITADMRPSKTCWGRIYPHCKLWQRSQRNIKRKHRHCSHKPSLCRSALQRATAILPVVRRSA